MRLPPWTGTVSKTALAVALVFYLADWALFRLRLAHGTGLGSVEVRQFMATPLKANRTEYDYVDTIQQPCVRSVIPHEALPPCWWLERHPDQWQSL
jgi:hypothetical protein